MEVDSPVCATNYVAGISQFLFPASEKTRQLVMFPWRQRHFVGRWAEHRLASNVVLSRNSGAGGTENSNEASCLRDISCRDALAVFAASSLHELCHAHSLHAIYPFLSTVLLEKNDYSVERRTDIGARLVRRVPSLRARQTSTAASLSERDSHGPDRACASYWLVAGKKRLSNG